MKKIFQSLLVLGAVLCIIGCEDSKSDAVLTFAISAEYPPFEYIEKGEIKGFDIDVAKLIGKTLGVQVVFENRAFNTIFPLLDNGQADAAISTITASVERRKSFDFSEVYYKSDLATIFKEQRPITTVGQLEGKKVACQLGSTMELWLKAHVPSASRVAMDHTNQAVEALKAGHVDTVLIDEVQALMITQKNPGLSYAVIAPVDEGYAIAFKKGSAHKEPVDRALKALIAGGELKKLEAQWLKDPALWKD
ncbi:MAG: amino acid ABC transporter substrate-binding protein [Gammaproteobacteria bacterium]|nr:amino acid ABC transporter substrate-binding protein [Gammaproteobacteria bacterium]MBP9729386.1 amino acid ABC transporter substrate-binding protein [Gammaproteobacteria bacterium]